MKEEKIKDEPLDELKRAEEIIEREIPRLTATRLKATPEAASGSLVVKIRARYPWRNEMPAFIDEQLPDPQPFDDPVEVTVEQTSPRSAGFGDSKYTAKAGDVSWDQIPTGKYSVTFSLPEGFELASYFISQCGEERAENLGDPPTLPLTDVKICDEKTTIVEVFLFPLLSAVNVLPFYDKDRSGDPTREDQIPITCLRASFRSQGTPLVVLRLLDAMKVILPSSYSNMSGQLRGIEHQKHVAVFARHTPLQTLLGPTLVQALQSLSDLSGVYLLWKRGTVSVVTESPVQATFPGQAALTLQAEWPYGTFVYVDRGSLVSASIAYVESQAEIQIAAFLEQECPRDPCNPPASGRPSTKKTPLPGVTFQLYVGSPQGEPYQQATTFGSAPHIFSNLPATNYYILASAWPPSFAGSNQIQPRPASGLSGPHTVTAGVPTKIEFCFASCLSRVTGIVTDGQAGPGVPGVQLTLALSGGNQSSNYLATSNSDGEYEFNNVTAGSYVVQIESEKIVLPGGRVLEVPAAVQAGYPISVPACGTVSAPVIQLNEDVHKIFGTATAPDGSILQYLRIEIQDKSGKQVAVTQTDANGQYQVLLPQAGFYLVVPQINGVPQIPVQVNSEVQVDVMAAPGGSPTSQQAATKSAQVQESEIDLQAYPVLTEEVPSEVVSRPPSAGGGPGIAPIGKMAENAIRDVLSWRAKANDPKSFILALNQSFSLKDVEGHTESTWTPRTYTVQTDMGAITGAQASIYTRAKVALDQSLPLLDGLYALLPVLEQEDLDSVRDLVRSLFTELVNDLGIEGGPRIPRVDQLFSLLLGLPLPTDPEKAGGQLGILRERFGLKRSFVTTIADEQNLTNYIVLVDYVIGLSNSWNTQKAYFAHSGAGSAEPFFGTQLVLLSRSLDVVAQAVKDVEFAMDSVFLGAAERQTILLDFTSIGAESSLFVAELLDWVDSAASNELPAQLQDSGKDAIGTLKQVVANLVRFVHAAILPQQPLKGLPPGYRTPRVQRALRLLADSLRETYRLAEKIRPPDFPPETPGR